MCLCKHVTPQSCGQGSYFSLAVLMQDAIIFEWFMSCAAASSLWCHRDAVMLCHGLYAVFSVVHRPGYTYKRLFLLCLLGW
jgi:hypothetical protein